MYKIVNVNDCPLGLVKCAQYFYSKWGSGNYLYFENAIRNSNPLEDSIPQFYILLYNNEIAGCFGLISNDFISRHDLSPWFSSLFVEPEHRGKRLSGEMFEHAKKVIKPMGYPYIYLTTEHDGLYEKFGWERVEDAFDTLGNKTRVYRIIVE